MVSWYAATCHFFLYNPRLESSAANCSQRGSSGTLIRRVGEGRGWRDEVQSLWQSSHCRRNMSCSQFVFCHKTLLLQRGQGECWQCSWAVHFLVRISVLCPANGRVVQRKNTHKQTYIYVWCQGSYNPPLSLCLWIPPGIKLGGWVAGPEHNVCVAHSTGLASNVVTNVHDCKELLADVSATLIQLITGISVEGT